jgi:hypothetical protein
MEARYLEVTMKPLEVVVAEAKPIENASSGCKKTERLPESVAGKKKNTSNV